MNHKPTYLAIWGTLAGVFFTLFANSSPADAGEWTFWILAAIGIVSFVGVIWAEVQLELVEIEREKLDYLQWHKAISYEAIIEYLVHNERYEDAEALRKAREKIDL